MKYLLRHPAIVDFAKIILSSKWLNNSGYYKKYILHKARMYASKYPCGEMGVNIETILDCNARCIMCAHSVKEMHGCMTMELFEKIIDDCHKNKINCVGLSIYGEPLLDIYFFDRIKYLRKYNMSYSFFTNGYLLDLRKAQMLFQLGGLEKINFSVCGYDRETYENVMVGLKRDITYQNILSFLKLKRSLKQNNITVGISTVKTHINKKDMRKFCRFWLSQKGVDYCITADLWDRIAGKKIDEIGQRGYFYKRGRWLMPCKQLWGGLYTYFDGRVAPCCVDSDLRELIIGDMNKQTLKEIYSSDAIRNLRSLHLADKRHTHKICGNCLYNAPGFIL